MLSNVTHPLVEKGLCIYDLGLKFYKITLLIDQGSFYLDHICMFVLLFNNALFYVFFFSRDIPSLASLLGCVFVCVG